MKIDLVNYSEKSFALFGDTKEIKDYLKEMGGKFNPYLNYNGGKKAGWIFSNNSKTKVELFLKGYSSVNDSNSITAQNTPIVNPEVIVQPEVKEIVKVAANVIKPQIKEVKPSVKKFNWQGYFKLKPNKNLDITQCLYFDTLNNQVIQTNLENFIIVPFWNGLQVNKSCCIALSDLKSIKDLQTLEVTDNSALVNGFMKVSTENIDIFPNKLPKFEVIETTEISDFSKVKNGLYSCSKDLMRPAMNGVYFSENEIATTNGHTLYFANINKIKGSYIINKEACNFINENCSISFGLEHSKIIFNDYYIIARNIDERYPNYKAVTPIDNPFKFNFDKKYLIEVVKKCLPFANKTTSQIRFEVKDNVCKISAEDLEFTKEICLSIDCNSNDNITFGINGKFLIEILNNLQSNIVYFECSTPKRPFLIKDNEATHLIMPMILPEHS